MRASLALGLAFSAVCALGCNGPAPGPPLAEVDLGPSLEAGRGDPVLLTFAAARARSRYLVDQGYTLAWDADDVPAFHTASAGDFGVMLEVDGSLYASEDYLATPVTIAHTASDAAVLRFDVDNQLSAEIWFVVGRSGAATIDVRLTSTALVPRVASVIPWLRRCDAPFTAVAPMPEGLGARRSVTPDPRLVAAGPGTFVTDFADALVGDEAPVTTLGAAACGAGAYDDVGLAVDGATPPPASATLLAMRFDRTIAAQSTAEVRVHRAVVDAVAAGSLADEIAAERALDLGSVLTAGKARLDAAPALAGPVPADALVYRSAFALLDQTTMPAEGALAHDYFLSAREPAAWDARLAQAAAESPATILLARLDPADAVASQRNFIDRVGADGFLPASIGPVVSGAAGVAAAPLFSFTSWEIARAAKDPAFLADAYAAGKTLHGFWVAERDQDQDGLAEWGSAAESLRDQGNVIWTLVAPPAEVEAVDLNSMLVMEETSLASMATALGLASEAAGWQAAAAARAARINAVMWDDVTGFYYDVSRATHGFTVSKPGDLERMTIAGLLPLWAGIVPADRRARLVAHAADPALFLRADGLATLSARDPFYAPQASACCRWNGPVVVPWEWLVLRGLRASGEGALADTIVSRTRAAVAAELAQGHQLRERYDADDPTRPNASSPNERWSTLVALMMLEAG